MRERRRSPANGPPRAKGLKAAAAALRTHCPYAPRSYGFSLLELIAVIAVIGIVLALVFPKLSGMEDRYLDSDSQRLSLLVGYLGEKASTARYYYRVSFDLRTAHVSVEASAAAHPDTPQ